jgi:peptidoglycan hydrolase-like protein with peptidoglycan-binding domain
LRSRNRCLSRIAVGAVLLAALAVAPSAVAAPQLGSRVLREGMSGGDVKTLQQLLTQAGFRTPADGNFGPATQTHLISFERKYHLTANGVVTNPVVSALERFAKGTVTFGPSGGVAAVTQSQSSSAPPTLREGAKGRWVTTLQRELNSAGYVTSVDGVFGPGLAQVVNQFKAAHGLAQDAVVGYRSWAVLTAAMNVSQATTPTAPPGQAHINPDGTVTAPANAPDTVKNVIAAANQIAFKPYIYGGGHASFIASGYDCSGSVSYALHGAGLISAPEDSTGLESYGAAGAGQWITIWANAGHTYMEIAGVYFDTAAQGRSNGNSRWSATRISPATGYVVRHPVTQ